MNRAARPATPARPLAASVAIGIAPPLDVAEALAEPVAELVAEPAELVVLTADDVEVTMEEVWDEADALAVGGDALAELVVIETDAPALVVTAPTVLGRMVVVMVWPPEVMVVTTPKMVVLPNVEVMVLPPVVIVVTIASVVTGTDAGPWPPWEEVSGGNLAWPTEIELTAVPVVVAVPVTVPVPDSLPGVAEMTVLPIVEVIVLPPVVIVVTMASVVTAPPVFVPLGPTAVPLAVRAEVAARELVPVTSRRVSRRCLGVHSLCILPAAQYWRPYAMMALVFVPGGQYWMVQSRTP